MQKKYIAPFLHVSGSSSTPQLKSLRPHHHAIMDYILANPTDNYGSVARAFKVTQAWLSTVINSDLFQQQLQERRALLDKQVNDSIMSKLQKMAEKGLDNLLDAQDDEEVSVAVQHDITKTALSALGFLNNGRGNGPSVVVNNNTTNNTMSVTSDAVAAARARIQERNAMRGLPEQSGGGLTIEHK